jgi:F-type H+-transporting ATPase subunit gamma
MSTINEVKEQMIVVRSVGDFTNAIQQIATMRMVQLRSRVLKSRPFVEAASTMLKEVNSIRNSLDTASLMKLDKTKKNEPPKPHNTRRAVIVITSNQGLTGPYNIEIYQRVEKILDLEKQSDFYVIGKKGQEYFAGGKFKVNNFPYEVPDDFTLEDLRRLVRVFDYYGQLTLVYSRFINTATRDVVATSIVNPIPEDTELDEKQPGKYTFEPGINELIEGISSKLRAALFQQQIFDARLSQFSAQMIGMQTASDNAKTLLSDLQLEYNKQRRKLIDKKISEVFAGSATWMT